MPAPDLFAELRPKAFAIAYQMLGSVSEAEDIVQEAFLRMHQTQQRGERIDSPRAYVATVVTRLAIDQLRSARARRENYVGEWLPEPIVTGPTPAEHAETADSLSLAILVLMESLSPQQRAAFLLREVFDYPYEEIADVIGTSVDNARQLTVRARAHVRQRRPRFQTSRKQGQELAQRFLGAAEQGDLKALEEMLAHDVSLVADGGGKVPALGRPAYGPVRVAGAIVTWTALVLRGGGATIRPAEVNGQPGAMAFDVQGRLVGIMDLDIAEGKVQAIHSIVNPDKLRHFDRVGDLGEVLRANRHQAPPRP